MKSSIPLELTKISTLSCSGAFLQSNIGQKMKIFIEAIDGLKSNNFFCANIPIPLTLQENHRDPLMSKDSVVTKYAEKMV